MSGARTDLSEAFNYAAKAINTTDNEKIVSFLKSCEIEVRGIVERERDGIRKVAEDMRDWFCDVDLNDQMILYSSSRAKPLLGR